MKVLIICQDFPNLANPASLRVLNSVKYLVENHGHEIFLITFMKKGIKYESLDFINNYCSEIKTIEIPLKANNMSKFINLIYNIAYNFPYMNMSFFFSSMKSVKMQREINKLIKLNDIDCIFVNYWLLLYPAIINSNKKRILEVHALSDVFYDSLKVESNILMKIKKFLQYKFAKNCESQFKKFDTCIAVSEKDKKILGNLEKGLNNIKVIPYGVNLEYFKPMELEEEFPSLIFVGNMSSENNAFAINYFYEKIFPLIKNKFNNIKLYIVGKDPLPDILKLGEDDSVIVTGFVEDMREYIAISSVVVAPLKLGYGLKTRILETMAMEKPIVATQRAVDAINVTNKKNIMIADKPEEFANKVIDLLDNYQKRKKLGFNARKLMEQEYSWKKNTEEFNRLLSKL